MAERPPVIDADGHIAEFVHSPLTEIAPGEVVTICRADTTDAGRLRFIADSHLMPGTRVTVLDRQPFHGPIALDVGGTERIIGHEIAALLLCAREVS